MIRLLITASLVGASIVLVSALPAPAPVLNDAPGCLSATATPEELGPSATSEDLARGFVCRENGEVVGSWRAGD